MDIEDFAETLDLSDKTKDTEGNFKQIQPIIQKYCEFINTNQALLQKKNQSSENSQNDKSNTQPSQEECNNSKGKSKKKESKKEKQADLLDLSKNK